jgi:low temperature requirement protein LtrA
MEVKEKKVELMELFYDLIYVYAIANMTLLIEEPENGVISWGMFISYIVSSMVIIQAWLYMTTYVNRYAMWRWYKYALTVVNMAAAIVMSTTISESYIEGGTAFVISMIVMISCVGTLYAIQLYIEKQDVAAARNSFEIIMVVLLIYGASLVLSLCGFKEESLLINVFAVILGIALLLFKHGDYDLKIISLPHLIERLELLTIITFGEGIVAITGFFTVSEISAVSVMIRNSRFLVGISLKVCFYL